MIPNFNPKVWNREKIIDYVIGAEQPLDDQQLAFLVYFDELKKENKILEKLAVRNSEETDKIKKICRVYDKVIRDKLKDIEKTIKMTEDEDKRGYLFDAKVGYENCFLTFHILLDEYINED